MYKCIFSMYVILFFLDCSVINVELAGNRFALGYDEPVTYSVQFCKEPFYTFSWQITNLTSTTNLRSEIVAFEYFNDTANCLQTNDSMQYFNASCMMINETCCESNLTFFGVFTPAMDETWFEIQFEGFNETCFSTPYPHIRVLGKTYFCTNSQSRGAQPRAHRPRVKCLCPKV